MGGVLLGQVGILWGMVGGGVNGEGGVPVTEFGRKVVVCEVKEAGGGACAGEGLGG